MRKSEVVKFGKMVKCRLRDSSKFNKFYKRLTTPEKFFCDLMGPIDSNTIYPDIYVAKLNKSNVTFLSRIFNSKFAFWPLIPPKGHDGITVEELFWPKANESVIQLGPTTILDLWDMEANQEGIFSENSAPISDYCHTILLSTKEDGKLVSELFDPDLIDVNNKQGYYIDVLVELNQIAIKNGLRFCGIVTKEESPHIVIASSYRQNLDRLRVLKIDGINNNDINLCKAICESGAFRFRITENDIHLCHIQ